MYYLHAPPLRFRQLLSATESAGIDFLAVYPCKLRDMPALATGRGYLGALRLASFVRKLRVQPRGSLGPEAEQPRRL